MIRTFGKAWLEKDECGHTVWCIQAEPHVLMRLKRVITKIAKQDVVQVHLHNTPENCRDLLWFIDRYPLQIKDSKALEEGAKAYSEHIKRLEDLIDAKYTPRDFNLALPLRDYQRRAVELYLKNEFLLLGDDVGLGKTAVAIGSFSDKRVLPACVVTLTVMPRQWEHEIHRFAPDIHTHIINKGQPYELPEFFGHGPDVVIINYHKLAGWASVLAKYCKSIVYDEVQELRRKQSEKYHAAKHISSKMRFRLGLSATPIYNYGGEFFNVLECLSPGALGDQCEFWREWCYGTGDKVSIREPKAFGTYLRENFIMLRRTRAEVGRELPPLTKVPHTIDSDPDELNRISESAVELAKIIVAKTDVTNFDKFEAAGQFDMLMRQATGIAKAPYVAAFVRMLVESGESVLLFGWHREVYSIWEKCLEGLNPVFFTGEESINQKLAAKEAFISGKSKVLCMSLRAGAGVDGLQQVCSTVVLGELDWSPGIHEQNIGRVFRDGQQKPVLAYFLISEHGSDPIVAETLGLKREQVEGIRNPNAPLIEKLQQTGANVQRLAREFLKNRGVSTETTLAKANA